MVALVGHVRQHEMLALVLASNRNNSLRNRSSRRNIRYNRHDSLRIHNNRSRNLFETEKHKQMRNNKKREKH